LDFYLAKNVQKYYNPMSLKEADKFTPQIRLSSIIDNLAPSDVKTERLIVMSPPYMKNLSDILSSTPKEVLQTYFIWKVVQAYSSVVEADELKPYSQFSNELQGKVKCPFPAANIMLMIHRTLTRPRNVGERVSIMWTVV
jgi:endothelin-converting enzyme